MYYDRLPATDTLEHTPATVRTECPACDAELADAVGECPHCGTDLDHPAHQHQ